MGSIASTRLIEGIRILAATNLLAGARVNHTAFFEFHPRVKQEVPSEENIDDMSVPSGPGYQDVLRWTVGANQARQARGLSTSWLLPVLSAPVSKGIRVEALDHPHLPECRIRPSGVQFQGNWLVQGCWRPRIALFEVEFRFSQAQVRQPFPTNITYPYHRLGRDCDL